MPPPTLAGRILGALAARRALSGYLVALGEPPAGLLEPLDALRARYRKALVDHAPEPTEAPTEDPAGDR